jgi:cobalamin biosynthesis protein CobD/CbiB
MTYNPPPPGPDQPQYSGGAGTPSPAWQSQPKGFFGALFDFSFNHFVTFSITKVLYVLGMIVIALACLAFIIAGFSINGGLGIIFLLFGLVASVVLLAFWRLTLEFYFSIARMSEDIHKRGLPEAR